MPNALPHLFGPLSFFLLKKHFGCVILLQQTNFLIDFYGLRHPIWA